MDFGRTQLSGLLNNTVHEKTRYIALLHRLKTLLGLSHGHKLILTSIDKLLLTAVPGEVFEHVNYQHPLIKILTEYLSKISSCPDGQHYFVDVVKLLVEQVSFLIDNGIRPKQVSDVLMDIAASSIERADDVPEIEGEEDDTGFRTPNEKTCNFIKKLLKNECVAELLIECIKATRSFDSERIRICKIPTGSLESSYKIDGFMLNREPEGTIKELSETSVGIFNCPLDINRTELKGTVLFHGHSDILNFSKDETLRIKEFVDSLNVNVLVIMGTVNDMFLEFVDKRNIMVLRVFSKFDLKRICDCVGGSIYNQLGPIAHKGHAKRVESFSDAGYGFTRIIGGCSQVSTIVLKSSVKEVLDEKERIVQSILAGLCKRQDFIFSAQSFHEGVIKRIGSGSAIKEAVCKALQRVGNRELFLNDKMRCLRYAIEFVGVLLEIDDYLMAKKDALDIKPPQPAGHWDEDH